MRAAEREENDPPRQRAEQAESDGSIKLKSAPCDPFRAPFPLFDLKRSQRDRISSPVVVRQQQSMSTLIRHGPRLDVPTRVNPRPAHKARPCCRPGRPHSRSAIWLEQQRAELQLLPVLSAVYARGRAAMQTGSSGRRATTPAGLVAAVGVTTPVASLAWVQLQARQRRPRSPVS